MTGIKVAPFPGRPPWHPFILTILHNHGAKPWLRWIALTWLRLPAF